VDTKQNQPVTQEPADPYAALRLVGFQSNSHDHLTEFITAYKCTRFDGTDYRTGRNKHEVGALIVEPNAEPSDAECGQGLHWSPTIRQTCAYINGSVRGPRARFFEILIPFADLLALGPDKGRSRSYLVAREVPFAEAFPHAAEWPARVEAVRLEMDEWKRIQWMKPAQPVTLEILRPLFDEWRSRLAPFEQRGRVSLPTCLRIVTSRADAADAADADAAAAAAADAAADADAAAAAAAAAADAADAADADAAAAAAAAAGFNLWWLRWYLRPRYALWRKARWNIYIGPDKPNPWAPIVEIYRLGCMPIGYSRNRESGEVEFVIYAPSAVSP
jgi:hypothetical protein